MLHRLDDAIKGGELSYMTLAMEREYTMYRSLLPLAGAVVADPEPTPLRLLRGCIAGHLTASWSTALLVPSRAASSAT